MGVAFVNSNENFDTSGTVSSLTVTTGWGPTAGNCLFIGITADAAVTISSVKDNNNVSYPLRVNGPSFGSDYEYIYALLNIGAGITSIVVTYAAGPKTCVNVAEYSGVVSFGNQVGGGQIGSFTAASLSMNTIGNNNFVVMMLNILGAVTGLTGTGGTSIRKNTTVGAAVSALIDNTATSPGPVTDGVTWTGGTSWTGIALELSTNVAGAEVQSSGFSVYASITSQTRTLTGVTAGDLLVVVVQYGSGAGTWTISDGVNTWHIAQNETTSGLLIAYALNVAAGSITVTAANNGSASNVTMDLIEYQMPSTAIYDTSAQATGTVSPPTLSISPSQALELVVLAANDSAGMTLPAPINQRETASYTVDGDVVSGSAGINTYSAGGSTGSWGMVGIAFAFSAPQGIFEEDSFMMVPNRDIATTTVW